MAIEPLRIETVADRVHDALRQRILDGDLVRGVKLRQQALAEELGVSRTPLREALGRLAAEGLVSFHPNRGAHVVDLTHEDVRAAYEARLVVEPGAARLAATRRPQAEIEAMLDAVAEQRRHDGVLSSYRASRAFHLALVRGSGNEYLVRTAEALWVPGIAQAIYERQAGSRDDTLADALEHERIVTAIAAGDPDLAEALVRRHIASALHRLLGEV